MKPRTFPELYEEAERHEDYWIAGAILEFTENLVWEMTRQRLTRTALAERLGTTPAYVTKILRGKVNFTLATMVRLSRALGTGLQVRLGTASRREALAARVHMHQPGGGGGGRSASPNVVVAASRPAALQARQEPARKPRRVAAAKARSR